MNKWINKTTYIFIVFIQKSLIRFDRFLQDKKEKKFYFLDKSKDDLNLIHLNKMDDELEPDEKERFSVFINALHWGIDQKNVNNIALLGGFGTGKSTILHHLIKEKKLSNHINISLANFEKGTEKIGERIEYSILEQLIFSAKSKDIPDSKIKRLSKTKWIFLKSILFLFLIYSFIYLFFDNLNDRLPHFSVYNPKFQEWFWFIYLTFALCYIIVRLYRYILNYSLSKISLSDIEVSKKENSTISLLNQHYDEIVYFFKETNKRIVFIEDLDRFDCSPSIFSKLREINTLLNNSVDLIGRKITFIYAVKNDFLGEHNDANKFFELVIPVIPFISHDSSKNVFIKKLKISEEDIDRKMLELIVSVSPYIFDTRTIYTIINDYNLTRKIYSLSASKNESEPINKSPISQVLMLSFCIYKNILNEDYNKLLNRDGLLFNLFNKKNSIRANINNQNQLTINKLTDDIKKSKEEILKNTKELRQLFIFELNTSLDSHESLETNDLSHYINEDIFEKYYLNGFQILNKNNRSNTRKMQFQELEHLTKTNYKNRKEAIQNKSEEEAYSKQINALHFEIKKTDSKSISELINKKNFLQTLQTLLNVHIEELHSEGNEPINNTLDKSKDDRTKHTLSINKFLLFQTLITEGYLNENYPNLLSYAHNDYLDTDSDRFRINVQNNEAPEFNTIIKSVDRLVASIEPMHFRKESVLNNDIFIYLINDKSSIKYDLIIEQYRSITDNNVSFYQQLVRNPIMYDFHKIKFTKDLIDNEYFWNVMSRLSSSDAKQEIIKFLLKNMTEFTTLKVDDKLKEFLDGNQEMFNKIENISVILVRLNYKIKSPLKLELEIFMEISEFKMFEINAENLVYLIQNQVKVKQKILNIESIKALYDSYARKWSSDDFKNDFEEILDVVSNVQENFEGNENIVLDYVLNNSEIKTPDLVVKYINKVDFRISDIQKVNKSELWILLIKENKIEATWNNVETYYSKSKELSKELIEFINFNDAKLNEEEYVFNTSNLYLLEKILESNEILNKFIFDNSTMLLNDISLIESNNELIEYLLKNKFVKVSEYIFIRLNDENKLLFLNNYFKGESLDYDLDLDFNIDLLSVKNIYSKIQNKGILKLITENFVNNHYHEMINFSLEKEFTDAFIENLKLINVDLITTDFIKNILESLEILDQRKKLVTISCKTKIWSKNAYEYMLSKIGMSSLSDGEIIHINNNHINRDLISVLQQKGIIDNPKAIKKDKFLSIKGKQSF